MTKRMWPRRPRLGRSHSRGRLCHTAGVGVFFLLVVSICSSVVFAGSDYSDKDLSVRFPSAFIRFRDVTTSGGETAANRRSSAVNPAAADWTDLPCELGVVLAPYYSHIQFKEGLRLHVMGEALTVDMGEWGTFQPTLGQMRSNRETDRFGVEFNYEADSLQLVWAKRFGDWGVGGLFNYGEAEMVNKLGPVRVSEGRAESYCFRVGGLYEPAAKWLTGLALEYSFAPTRATVLAATPLGPMSLGVKDTHERIIVRPGISYEYQDQSTVFADYQYGLFFNDEDTLNCHRFNGGIDHRLLDWLFVRAGGFIDVRGNVGWTCGLGAYFSKWCSIDVGYQYDTLPELRPEFGRSHTLQVALSVSL